MKIKYYPEIDGLRALAVLFVIFYHLDFSFNNAIHFKNGFFGVDIFFVISGYLITLIILKELYETKNFSFLLFYERRIRRIIPLFLVVGLITSIPAWFFMLPSDFILLSKSFLSSSFFFSNFYFYEITTDYFARESELIPFLHTWSLSIEEQYYLITPLILFILFKYKEKFLLPVLFLLFFLSLDNAYNIAYSEKNFDYFFYSFFSRFWEILTGSIIAITKKKFKIKKDILTKSIPVISIVFVFVIIFVPDVKNDNYINYLFLLILFTAIFIYFSENNDFASKLLSSPPFVFIGLLSYSLYLWHYPIISFYHIIPGHYFLSSKYLVLLAILSISLFSYSFIEKPFRKRNEKNQFNIKISNIVIFFIVTIIFYSLILQYKGFPERFSKINEYFENYQIDNKLLETEKRNFLNNKKNDFKTNLKKVIIIGDSHSEDTFLLFELNKDLYDEYEFLHLDYSYINNLSDDVIFKKADIIIFSIRWHYRIANKIINLDELFESANKLKSFGKKIVITSNSIEQNQDRYYRTWLDKQIMNNYFNLNELNDVNFNLLQTKKINKFENSNDILKSYAERYNFIYLNKDHYLCSLGNNECFVLTDKKEKVFYDYGHYTLEGASFLGKKAYEINWFDLSN